MLNWWYIQRTLVCKVLNLCYKISQLKLYREIHKKHKNSQCGQNVELVNVNLVVHIVTTSL